MNNILLTGSINIGKSTIISQVVKKLALKGKSCAGFYTLPRVINGKLVGFYIEPILWENPLLPIESRMIARNVVPQWIADTRTFEDIGKEVLEYALSSVADLVVMDELGFFESDAIGFQAKVMELLDSEKTVLGVIKPLNLPFLNNIRKRDDVCLYEVTKENRDLLPELIMKKVDLHLLQSTF